MENRWRTLRVPASSANLGPGFDALALALSIYLECRFRRASALSIRASGCDAGLISIGEDNLIWQTALQKGASEPIELEIVNSIPVGKGLGSSAAAVTAGVVIGAEIARHGWDRMRILDEASRLEGHPDNVAACVLGGFVAAAIDSSGVTRAVKLPLPPNFGVAVVVPDQVLPTQESRGVLPDSYSREDAIFNVQRAALLVAALASGSADAFPAALEDRLHQPYRYALVPGLEDATKLRAAGLLGCALSGAGPSILVFYERAHEHVCQSVREILASRGRPAHVFWTDIAASGYELV